MTPRYTHACPHCVFLGREGDADVYCHPPDKSHYFFDAPGVTRLFSARGLLIAYRTSDTYNDSFSDGLGAVSRHGHTFCHVAASGLKKACRRGLVDKRVADAVVAGVYRQEGV
jgi:hypothetical protein